MNKYKEGYINEDNKVFWRIRNKKEIWITKEQYERRKIQRNKYHKNCMKIYYERRAKKDIMDIPYFGKYDFSKNKYFIGISTSGKELWVNKERLESLRKIKKQSRTKYVEKMKKLPKTGLKIGDVSPDNADLFVLFLTGNKPFFGSKEQLIIQKEALKRRYILRDLKSKYKKRILLGNLKIKLKRSDVHPETNMIFWMYSKNGKEVWMNPEDFKIKREKIKEIRRLRRIKKVVEN